MENHFDKNSFLAGLAVGRRLSQLGANGGAVLGNAGQCKKDAQTSADVGPGTAGIDRVEKS